MAQLVEAAHKAGVKVDVGLEPKNKMPQHFPNDPHVVTALLNESERITRLGIKWSNAESPNPIAAQMCFQNGWAYNLAAVWLRCYLKGEVGPDKE